MKKTILARGFIGSVASLLGVLAVGCGADTGWEGAAGEGEIDSVEQAITVNTRVQKSGADYDMTATPDSQPWSRAGMCMIHNPATGADLLVAAGGIEGAAGTAVNKIRVFNPATPVWTTIAATLSSARLDVQAIQDPSDNTRCILVGGASTIYGAASNVVQILDIDNLGAFSIANAPGNLAAAASNGFLTTCLDTNANPDVTRLVLIGGQDTGAQLTNIQVAPANLGNWTTVANLTDDRADFAGVKEPGSNNHYAVAGGDNSGGPISSIELITLSSACGSSAVAKLAGTNTLSTAVAGNVGVFDTGLALPSQTAGTFVFSHGATAAPALPIAADALKVTAWGSSPSFTLSKAHSSLGTGNGAYRPVVVEVDGTHHVYVGGADRIVNADSIFNANPRALATDFISGTWDTKAIQSRFLPAAGLISGHVYAGAGQVSFANGARTYRVTTEDLQSP